MPTLRALARMTMRGALSAGTIGGMEHTKLSRADASAAVTGLGWRYVLGEFRTEVLTGSLPLAADVAGRAAAMPGVEGHLRMDIRADRLLLSVQTAERAWLLRRATRNWPASSRPWRGSSG